MDNRHFILKTDHMNLTYLNVTLTGKVLRWKLYLQDKDFHLSHVPGKEVHQFVPDALSRLCENLIPPTPLGPIGRPNKDYPTMSMPRSLASIEAPQRRVHLGPHCRIHSAMPMLPSDESSSHSDQDAPIHLRVLQPIRGGTLRPHRSTQT